MNGTTSASVSKQQVWVKTTHIVINCTIFILSVIGNMFIMLTLVRVRRVKKLVDKLVLNLLGCNLLLVIISIPTDLIERSSQVYPFGSFGCFIIHPLSTYAINADVLTLVAIAFERWKVIEKPLAKFNKRFKVIVIISSTHFFGFIAVVPYALSLKINTVNNDIQCSEMWSDTSARVYTVALFAIQYAVPVPVMLMFYLKAWVTIQKTNITVINKSIKIADTSARKPSPENGPCSRLSFQNDRSVSVNPSANFPFFEHDNLNNVISPAIAEEDLSANSYAGENNALLNAVTDESSSSLKQNRKLSLKILSSHIFFFNRTSFKLRALNSSLKEFKKSPGIKKLSKNKGVPADYLFTEKKQLSLRDNVPDQAKKCKWSNDWNSTKKFSLVRRISLSNRILKKSKNSAQSVINYIFPNTLIKRSTLQYMALQKRLRKSRDLLRMFTVVVMVFIVFMLPNQIYWLTMYFSSHDQNKIATDVVYILTYASCVLNPWIYGGLNSKFRKDFRKVWMKMTSRHDHSKQKKRKLAFCE